MSHASSCRLVAQNYFETATEKLLTKPVFVSRLGFANLMSKLFPGKEISAEFFLSNTVATFDGF